MLFRCNVSESHQEREVLGWVPYGLMVRKAKKTHTQYKMIAVIQIKFNNRFDSIQENLEELPVYLHQVITRLESQIWNGSRTAEPEKKRFFVEEECRECLTRFFVSSYWRMTARGGEWACQRPRKWDITSVPLASWRKEARWTSLGMRAVLHHAFRL